MYIHPLDLPHIIRHPNDAQGGTELAPFTAGRFSYGILQLTAVVLAVGTRDEGHVLGVPVIPDEARDEKLAAELVAA